MNKNKVGKRLALALIGFYQRFVSPHKGFGCAYRVHTGGQNCSAYGYRVVQRFGFRVGSALIRRRMRECGRVYREHRPAAPVRNAWGYHRAQAGFCDAFDACDVADCDMLDAGSCACDGLDACSVLPCDFGGSDDGDGRKFRSRRKRSKGEPPAV